MLRTFLTALAAIVLIAVFAVLIKESRTTNESYFVEHAERMRLIEVSRGDINSIQEAASNAFEVGATPGSTIEVTLSRLTENGAMLSQADEKVLSNVAIGEQLVAYQTELGRYVANVRQFAAAQSGFADALRTLQEDSPEVVKELRRRNLRLESQNVFSLALAIIEHATGGSNPDGAKLTERLETLGSDRNLFERGPTSLPAFLETSNNVIEQRSAAESALADIRGNRLSEILWSLSNEVLNDNRQRVSRAERASLLLAFCTVLLLLGTGYAMWRLQASYRELNASNHELARANDTLEDSVADRTEELSEAYTELKESQVQLVQAEKMSSLGELVAGISHEINTPLWYLISNSTVLQERMETISEFCAITERMVAGVKAQENVKQTLNDGLRGLSAVLDDGLRDDIEESQDLIRDCIEGLEELTELAQSLKDFSRLDRAREGELDIHDGLNKALLIAKNKLKNKVTVHKHFGELPTIMCSPSQINQVFLNLLTNAADAIEDSGELVISTSVQDGSVRVAISDTGSGIPEDVIAKIRDPFFTTKEVGKGTGLGLSIVDQIITAHGGELLVESVLGKGTTMTVVLPLVMKSSEGDDEQVADDAAANDAALITPPSSPEAA